MECLLLQHPSADPLHVHGVVPRDQLPSDQEIISAIEEYACNLFGLWCAKPTIIFPQNQNEGIIYELILTLLSRDKRLSRDDLIALIPPKFISGSRINSILEIVCTFDKESRMWCLKHEPDLSFSNDFPDVCSKYSSLWSRRFSERHNRIPSSSSSSSSSAPAPAPATNHPLPSHLLKKEGLFPLSLFPSFPLSLFLFLFPPFS